ncbi:MAG: hypothetical protein GY926_03970 [bacterium]|nr:hypothetical protein [bacterium]
MRFVSTVMVVLAVASSSCSSEPASEVVSTPSVEAGGTTELSPVETSPVPTGPTVPIEDDSQVDEGTPTSSVAAETVPDDVVTPTSSGVAETVPDDVAVALAQQSYVGIDGICDDVSADPSLFSGGNCLSPIGDGTFGPNAYSLAAGFNPVGFVITYKLTEDGWAIDQEIDTSLIFATCDVPAPPADAEVLSSDHGFDIDFNKGEDRIVVWSVSGTTFVQAYGESTLKSEPYEIPKGYELVGSGNRDGSGPDDYLILADKTGDQIEIAVNGCEWAPVFE